MNTGFFSVIVASHTIAQDCVEKIEKKKQRKKEREREQKGRKKNE